MSTIVTRAGKGSALTHTEVDANFTNLNTDKVEAAQSVTLTNKTIALGSNTVSGTTAQFNTALTDGDFATLAGSETLTNKTISGSSNTLSNIGNSSLTNSSVTIGSTSVSLGSTATTVSGLTLSSPTISGGTVNNASVGATTPSTGAFTTLSATGVTTVQAGTAAAPAITTSGDTNTGVFFPAADTVAIGTGGTERLRVDSAGNMGLGVTPNTWFSGYKVFETGSGSLVFPASATTTQLWNNLYVNAAGNVTYKSTGIGGLYALGGGGNAHVWYSAPSGTAGTTATLTQAMTLDASGNLLIGRTTQAVNTYLVTLHYAGSASKGGILFNDDDSGQTYEACYFRKDNAQRGYIRVTTTGTTYATVSDYRLKENVQPMAGALAKVAALKPCSYTWKDSEISSQGFIAHELQAVVPECVTGEKDAVDADGNPVYQGIDTSFLVATLTAAIQEQQAMIDELKAKVAALENA